MAKSIAVIEKPVPPRQELANRAKGDFRIFIREAWRTLEPGTPLLWNWHIDAIAEHLQALYNRQITRLIIGLSPGHAKSTIVSQMFPVWCWVNDPYGRWLCASHSLDLALRDNVYRRRLIESDWFQAHYGSIFQFAGDQNLKCLLGSTKIQTDHGELAIQDIVEQKMNVRVFTFNHAKSIIENKYILAYEKHPGRPCVQVSCSNGSTISCTLNHPFYVLGKGYIEARYLKSGDTVYARTKGVRGVWEGISSSLSEPKDRQILTACMQQGLPKVVDTTRDTAESHLPAMREVQRVQQGRDKTACLQVLQPCLSCGVVQPASRQSHRADMSGMREVLPSVSSFPAPEILFTRLLSGEASLENTWDGPSSLREGFWNNVTAGTQARWESVHALSELIEIGSPSYRSQQAEQYRRQSDHSMPVVSSEGNTFSRQAGGVETTTITAIIADISPSFVYNLEIEDNHNYFANGILTHNSFFQNDKRGHMMALAVRGSGTGKRATTLLIDDANNAMAGEADIKATIEWHGKTWASRINDQEKGMQIVVGQRLDERDLIGHLLRQGGWEHLCLPEEFEPARRCRTSIGWVDPRTEEGQLLWPKRFPQHVLDKLKQGLGSMNYAAQFLQSPVPSTGGQFKEKWFRYCSIEDNQYVLQTPQDIRHVAIKDCWRFTVVDLAISTKQSADWTVIQTYDVTPQNELLLIDQIRGHFDNPEQQRIIRATYFRLKPQFVQIESVSYQLALIQQLRDEPVTPVAIAPNPIMVGDFLVKVGSIEALDRTLQLLNAPAMKVWAVKDENGHYVMLRGCGVVRVQGDIYYFKYMCEHQGYCTIISDVREDLLREYEQEQRQKYSIPIKEYKPVRDKVSRASAPALLMENGKFFFLDSLPDLHTVKTEYLQFPKGAHDDIVDCGSQAAEVIFVPSGPVMWSVDSYETPVSSSLEVAPSTGGRVHSIFEDNFDDEGEMYDFEAGGGRW